MIDYATLMQLLSGMSSRGTENGSYIDSLMNGNGAGYYIPPGMGQNPAGSQLLDPGNSIWNGSYVDPNDAGFNGSFKPQPFTPGVNTGSYGGNGMYAPIAPISPGVSGSPLTQGGSVGSGGGQNPPYADVPAPDIGWLPRPDIGWNPNDPGFGYLDGIVGLPYIDYPSLYPGSRGAEGGAGGVVGSGGGVPSGNASGTPNWRPDLGSNPGDAGFYYPGSGSGGIVGTPGSGGSVGSSPGTAGGMAPSNPGSGYAAPAQRLGTRAMGARRPIAGPQKLGTVAGGASSHLGGGMSPGSPGSGGGYGGGMYKPIGSLPPGFKGSFGPPMKNGGWGSAGSGNGYGGAAAKPMPRGGWSSGNGNVNMNNQWIGRGGGWSGGNTNVNQNNQWNGKGY